MTRYTNLGRKRTYVDASFNYHQDETEPAASTSTQPEAEPAPADAPAEGEDVKAKRKRRRKSKGKTTSEVGDTEKQDAEESDVAAESVSAEGGQGEKEMKAAVKTERKKKAKKMKARRIKGPSRPASPPFHRLIQYYSLRSLDAETRAAASEHRRHKRIAERHANTTCFACREQGHAAMHCPNVKPEDDGGTAQKGKEVVGICYRCGSQKHTLAKCRKTVNPANPLPFASCFVCSGKGHLASACSQNKNKGIYPNGGCCKLCGQNDHLAKNCGLRTNTAAVTTPFVGTGGEAGADEDDFHIFKRKAAEVDREEFQEDKSRKMAKVRAGAHSGIVKAFGNVPVKPKKIIIF
ncbi:hypothetical protein EWM64_g8508 [Hericium alpestre]|uniref:CCHC-type domain-containing protein n=1 Tax=Hericium alpestre TaxID=135208 RepID=A0A4Y9ZL01_9AGAM|nr:hypothetical protein EWM64_g8508 [Hericium alpestre]